MSSIGRIVRKNHSALFWSTRHYPKGKREAIYTIYAFVKHLDELSSSSLPFNKKNEIFAAWERELFNIYDKKVPETAIGRRIYKNCMRFKISRENFEGILSAFAKDGPTPLFCPSYDEFMTYCRGVSEIPSTLVLKIIAEFDDETTGSIGSFVGRAVEITNILKNIKEDMLGGHVYIPREFLEAAEIDVNLSPKDILTHKNLYVARQKLADIARTSFAEAYRLLEECHNRSSMPVVYMLNHYHAYFELMDRRGWEIISPKPELKFKDRFKLILKGMFGGF